MPDQVIPLHVMPDQVIPDQVIPLQVMPDQVIPLQVMPDHVIPDQVIPDQVIPRQVMPDHVIPDQVIPDQVIPLQVMPDHVIPFQLVPVRAPAVHLAASHRLPRTSCSPVTVLPFTSTCTDPRESSREPRPVDTVHFWTAFAGVPATRAAARSIVPLPWAVASAFGSFRAVPVSRAFTWSGVRSGRCESSSAAAPEMTAAACDVPEPRKNRSPVRAPGLLASRFDPEVRRLTTDLPGATTSGLRVPSPVFDHPSTLSSSVAAVPLFSMPPTAMTYGS